MSTLSRTKGYVKYWQKQLRILDWKIEIEVKDDVTEFDAYAQMKHNRNYQTAVLTVLEPKKIPEDWTGSRDLEVTTVHELIHTRLVYCPSPKEKDNHHLEMAIETLAVALVANRRGISPEEIV